MTRRLRNPEVVGWLLMAAAIAIAAAFIVWLQRGLIFGSDEYLWLELAGLGNFGSFFHPYGGHLIFTGFALWRIILELFGTDFGAFTAVQVFGLSLAALLLYIYSKRRVGPILALSPAIILLFIGSSWSPLLQPMIGIQFLLALVPGLAALLFLEHESRRSDIAACLMLCVALAGFTEAVAFLAGAALWIVLKPEWKRRAWVVVIPAVLYFAWHLYARKYGAEPVQKANAPWVPMYVSDSLAVIATSIFGQGSIIGFGHWTEIRLNGYDFGQLAAGIVIFILEALIVWRAIWLTRRREGGLPKTLWPALLILLTLWVAQAAVFAYNRTPAEIRYIYAGTLLLLLVVMEMLRGIETNRLTVLVALAITTAAVLGNLPHFREARQLLDAYQATARADMTVLELGGRNVKPGFTPNVEAGDLVDSGLALNVGPWRQVVHRYGSLEDSIPELRAQGEEVRAKADALAVRAMELELKPASGKGLSGCREVGAVAAAPTEVVLPPGGAVLTSGAESPVTLRRWASAFDTPIGSIKAHRPTEFRVPTDEAGVPWRLSIQLGGPIDVCPI